MQAILYLSDEEKDYWYRLLLEHGYIPRKKLGPAFNGFIRDCMSIRLAVDTPLVSSPTLHYSERAVHISVPDMIAEYPRRYQLRGWSDFVYNMRIGKISPVEGDWPSLPSSLAKYATPLSELDHHWDVSCSFTQEDLESYLPILDPFSYIDNRALHLENLVAPNFTMPYAKWTILYLKRTPQQLHITKETERALIALARHYNIIPIKRRAKNSTLTLTIEALHHKLLIPRDTII